MHTVLCGCGRFFGGRPATGGPGAVDGLIGRAATGPSAPCGVPEPIPDAGAVPASGQFRAQAAG